MIKYFPMNAVSQPAAPSDPVDLIPRGLLAWYDIVNESVRVNANFLLPFDVVKNIDVSVCRNYTLPGTFWQIEEKYRPRLTGRANGSFKRLLSQTWSISHSIFIYGDLAVP